MYRNREEPQIFISPVSLNLNSKQLWERLTIAEKENHRLRKDLLDLKARMDQKDSIARLQIEFCQKGQITFWMIIIIPMLVRKMRAESYS